MLTLTYHRKRFSTTARPKKSTPAVKKGSGDSDAFAYRKIRNLLGGPDPPASQQRTHSVIYYSG
jgi:hypothetical protein